MEQGNLDPQTFVDTYGLDAPVAFDNGMNVSLGQALQMEAMFCTADAVSRQDPAKRVRYLAGMLAAGGTLLPEHEYLLRSESE